MGCWIARLRSILWRSCCAAILCLVLVLDGGGVRDLTAQGVATLAQATATVLVGLPLGEERIDA